MNDNTPTYRLLDSGHGRKLEQVGPYRLVRPASQALWPPSHPAGFWETAEAHYQRGPSGSGNWHRKKHDLPAMWTLTYCGLPLRVKLTDFGHLGFFPEHGPHWQWLREQIAVARRPVRVLNAFAYTGSSTLAAAAGGGNRYDAIILDPPSFGRGPKGEVWKLTHDLPPLLDLCRQILSDSPLAVVLSTHTPGITPLVLENMLAAVVGLEQSQLCSMEMFIPQCDSPHGLPSGALVRWRNDTY
jgi:23S rRNA (cytosine1962-C5)-methyltransferase